MIYNYQSYSFAGKRAVNEDDYFPRQAGINSNIFVICDGIGGHGNGELASRYVIDAMSKELALINDFSEKEPLRIISEVNACLIEKAKEVGNPKMGSTLAFFVGQKNQALVGWVGDSRIYHIRDGKVLFKSKDHSLVELLYENGDLTEEEYNNYPMKHIIWQAMGTQSTDLNPGLEVLPALLSGDNILLATDGVLDVWPEHELLQLFPGEPQNISDALLSRCKLMSTDNFTFTLVEVKDA